MIKMQVKIAMQGCINRGLGTLSIKVGQRKPLDAISIHAGSPPESIYHVHTGLLYFSLMLPDKILLNLQ